MTAKEYLSQIEAVDEDTEILIDVLARSVSQLTAAKAATLSDMPKGGTPPDLADAVDAYEKLRAKINAKIAKLCRLKMDAIDAIYSVEDALLRRVLEHRYLQFMEWEDIRADMGYDDVRSVYYLHGKALQKVAEKIH